MRSDIETAQEANKKPIAPIASNILGIAEHKL
jgi:hypothetical protein